MNLIDSTISRLKKENSMGLMTHIVVGYPNLQASYDLIMTMAEAGADFIELQIPFSDPLADGPTMMKAATAALEGGVRVADSFELMQKVSKKITIPLLFMGYYNTVFCYSVEKFCQDAAQAGASGLIFPDMPLDEEPQEHFFEQAKKNDLINIRFISPASTLSRIKLNTDQAPGFLYCFSRYGVTGSREDLDPRLPQYLQKVAKYASCPLAVGFGISQPKHIRQIAPYADIAIVGSKILQLYDELPASKKLSGIRDFIQELKKPLKN